MTDIFTLGLKADTTDIDKGATSLDNIAKSAEGADKKTGQMREGVNNAGKAIAAFGVTTAAALGAITVSAGDAAREITNLSRLTNQTVEDFQRTAFAARQFGIEQDKLGDILKDVQDKVGDFLRSFILSDEVDHDRISARLNNGVLRVELPRASRSQPRRIAVTTD